MKKEKKEEKENMQRKEKRVESKEKGITLVALVITIIVLLILAGVTISMVVGDNGIITKAQQAKQNMANATAEEEQLIQNLSNAMNAISEEGSGGSEIPPEEEPESIPTTDSYVGYYADLDGNPETEPEGIIYADLAIGGEGQWGNTNGSYTIGTQTNLKDYYISQESYSGKFGTHPVLAPKKTNIAGKNDRFYVMALENVDGSPCCFYRNGNMTVETSTNFGTGKQNTATMMDRWNNAKYGSKDINDLWGFIKTQVQQGWFVPSRGEWGAFLNELGITRANYSSFGLSKLYWSSSQYNSSNACHIRLTYGIMDYNDVYETYSVRLSTTF